MEIAFAPHPSIERTWKRRNASPEKEDHGPYDPLGRQSRRAVSKTKSKIEKHFAPPSNREEDGGDRVKKYPTIPSSKIDFKDEDFLVWIHLSGALNETNDGLGIREGELPVCSTVKMGVNETVDAPVELGTANDCPPNLGTLLANCVERATIYVKR